MKSIQTLGADFVQKHEWLLGMTHTCGVAICGGCAAAIVKEKTDYVPADLDLIATKDSALAFIRIVTDFLLEKQVHFRIYANSRNDFVPKPAVAHFRIQTPFWVPICIFVLPYDKFRTYRIPGKFLLQLSTDVQKAAEELTKVDEKPRIASDLEEQESEMTDEEMERDALADSMDFHEFLERQESTAQLRKQSFRSPPQ